MFWQAGPERFPDFLNSRIWRYMDFTKFVYMLDKKSLFFCRPDCLADRFEGTWPKATLGLFEARLRKAQEQGTNIIGGVDAGVRGIASSTKALRSRCAVNCWHMNHHESEAMWRLYIQAGQGIAIESTVQRLINCLSDDPAILIRVDEVDYLDFNSGALPVPDGNPTAPFLYKRIAFAHERELRAIAMKGFCRMGPDSGELRVTGEEFSKPGENVAVDLSVLIESVYLSPACPPWQADLVRSVSKQYGFGHLPIKPSKLDDEPI